MNFKCVWSQIADLRARQRKEMDEINAANEIVMERVEKLATENGDLSVNNTTLKVKVSKHLEHKTFWCMNMMPVV